MIESSLQTYLVANLDTSYDISWGKVDANADWDTGLTTINFTKVTAQSARTTPSYLDNFQLSVRNKYIDAAQSAANEIITLFHLYFGAIGDYNVVVDDVFLNGVLYEDDDLVHIPITLRLKYTEL